MVDVGVYARISRDDGTRLGVARQEADCRAAAEARGWTVTGVYVDNDVSAYSGRVRPDYERLLADIEAGAIAGVVAWHPDRLHRSTRELERFIDVVEATGAKVSTVQAGELDLATASGRMTARVVGAVARHEAEHKSERQKRKALELAEAGKVGGGGTRPYGYEADQVTVVEAEAEAIRDLAARVVAGETIRSLCRTMTDSGKLTTTGRAWSPQTMRRLLLSPRIAGLREHQGEVVANAVWPAVIDRATHEAVKHVLSDPRRNKRKRAARSYLLTGIAHCGICGAGLIARPRSDGRRSQVCATGPGFSGCGKIRVLAEPLEELIAATVVARADSPELAEVVSGAPQVDRSELLATVADLEARVAELAEAWADGDLSRTAWRAASTRLEERLESARADLAAVGRGAALAGIMPATGTLAAAWPFLTFDQRRAIVGAVVDRVDVGPGVRGRNFFDPTRVNVVWRA